jgi:dephospho-CoA kinase
MKVIGVTGGIGMGKSTLAGLLRRRGVPVVDTDEIAREIVAPGEPVLEEIRRLFGADVIDPQGRLRREEVARRVFSRADLRRQLEGVTHPRIRERWHAQIARWQSDGLRQAAVVIPLLFEVRAESEMDVVICAACSAATQRGRLLARGWTGEQTAQRIEAQWPVEKKLARANYVVWTEGEVALAEAQLDRILSTLGVEAGPQAGVPRL